MWEILGNIMWNTKCRKYRGYEKCYENVDNIMNSKVL